MRIMQHNSHYVTHSDARASVFLLQFFDLIPFSDRNLNLGRGWRLDSPLVLQGIRGVVGAAPYHLVSSKTLH